MRDKQTDRWERDEFQIAKTGEIDTRGLYISFGLVFILMFVSILKINWATTETQMLFVFYVLLIHQLIEQNIHMTDTYFLKMKKVHKVILAFGSLIMGLFFLANFFSFESFVNHQIKFTGMISLMQGTFFIIYFLIILFVIWKDECSKYEE